jgi:hypothetical protein
MATAYCYGSIGRSIWACQLRYVEGLFRLLGMTIRNLSQSITIKSCFMTRFHWVYFLDLNEWRTREIDSYEKFIARNGWFFYYYLNKKIYYNIIFFSYKLFLLYITSITFYYYLQLIPYYQTRPSTVQIQTRLNKL